MPSPRRLAAACLVFAAAAATAAAGPLLAPSGLPVLLPGAIVLYVHESVRDDGFVERLAARLDETFAVPVFTRRTAFPYADAPTRTAPVPPRGQQRDGFAMLERFYALHAGDGPAGAFQFVLVEDDLWRAPYRFLFSFSFGDETTVPHLSVVSLARLGAHEPGVPEAARRLRTSDRVFRLIAKNVARLGGYAGTGGCILGFARSVEELDRVPPVFCDADAAALRSAGLLEP